MSSIDFCPDCFYCEGRHHPHCPSAEDDDSPPPLDRGDEIDHAWDQIRDGLREV